MTLSNIRATFGLNATATLGAAGTSGNLSLGQATQTLPLTGATKGYSLLAIFAGFGTNDVLSLNLLQNTTTGSTAWVAGAAQVETATAAGTITTAGNATAIIESAGMSGSPITVTFAVALSDTAAQWAAKARSAVASNATIAERFTVSGTGAAIVLTRKPAATFATPEGSLPIYVSTGNDGTINVALANATSAGITAAATSANTTAGVPTDGVKIYDGDGKDLEGTSITLSAIHGFQASVISTADILMAGGLGESVNLTAGETLTRGSVTGLSIDEDQVFTATAPASLAITVFGA